ncbi:hypothetical protein E4J66_12550 [Actinomyces viscosus]|uniref:DUF5655 domain-containing protein n=1 Tax=Actinomyces viscosus TaxID=1656 RepID=A0A3S5EWE3_ACTVI|nr:DUF5655 domain-containing protein [Actinomyces viscosus]TFH51307.1 hypothetical protein E4J66_12550 [Actinomyces viscosus]VEI15742.1 Uncharacterised protein [Actinomyces viscosus]
MSATSNKMIGEFRGKPATAAMYTVIESYVVSLGDVTKHLTAQVSFSVNRKFLWAWAYEKTADGTLFLNVRLDQPLEDPNVHRVTQVSANRWNHHVVVKTMEAAQSEWLRTLIGAGYEFASR